MKRNPALIVIGLLALLAALAVGCGDDSSSTSAEAGNPEDTVRAFFEAYQDQDGEAACALFSADSQEAAAEGFDSCEEAFQDAADSGALDGVPDELAIESSSIDGDTATVETTAGGEQNTITLVNEDGWKVDVEAADAASTSGTDTTGDTDATTP